VSIESPPSCRLFAYGKPAKVAHKNGPHSISCNHLTQSLVTGGAVEDTNFRAGIFHIFNIPLLYIRSPFTTSFSSLPLNGPAAAKGTLPHVISLDAFRAYQVKDILDEMVLIW
jgi:hypothetical protein